MKTTKIYLFTVLTLAALTVAAQSPRLRYSIQPDVATAVYTNNSFNVTNEEGYSQDFTFNYDGTKLFIVGRNADKVFEYALSTAYDPTTASLSSEFDVSAEESDPQGLVFNAVGTRLFLTGNTTDSVYQYNLSTGFDITTASFSGQALFLGDEDNFPQTIELDVDGETLFMVGNNLTLYQYSLSNPDDIETAALSSTTFDLSGTDTGVQDLVFSGDGMKLYILGLTGDRVYEFDLSAPFDISNPQLIQSFSVSSQAGSPVGIDFNELSDKMYILNDGSSDLIFEYQLENVAFEETLSNTGVLAGTLIIDISIDTFVNAGGVLTSPTHFTITNTPSGLTPTLLVDASGLFVTLDLSGSATANDFTNDLEELQFVFTDAAFENSTAAQVTNSTQDVSVEINFRPGEAVVIPKSLSYAIEPDITTSVFSNNVFVVNDQDTDPRGLAFNHDGTLMYMFGRSSDQIYQYDLSTAYDITTASFGTAEFNQFSFANENVEPRGITFKPDGTRMYMVANSSEDRIYQYDLAAPFDVSSAAYSDISFNVFTQDEIPQSIRFNASGTKLFMIGSSTDAIYQYSLGTPYDVSSATYDNISLDLSAIDTAPTDLEFSNDGTRLYVAGTTNDRIFAIDLNTAYDISSSTSLGSFQVSSETSFPAGLVFDGTGTVMYVLGNSSSASFDRVIEYNLEDVAFEESLANTGVLEGTLTISIDGETFANSGGTLTSPEHFSIANSPAGLTPTLAVDASGSFANLVFSGSATSNDVSNDLDELQFTLTDDAFQMTTASEVSNSNKDVSVEVNFRPGEAVSIAKSLSYAIEPDITTAVFSNTVFEVNSQDSDPRGLAWNHDGTRLFILGTASDNVYQYDLTTPYDITTASFGIAEFNQFSISNENTDPRGIFFRPDGTRMYVVGTSGEDRVYQYDLVAPFDVSSASYNSISLNVFSQDNDPQAVRFNSDGTLMFLVGNSSNSIYQYLLTTPYDVSSASYDDVLIDLSTTDVTPVDLEFSADGTRLFVSGTSNDRIFAFDLNTAYDISSSTSLGSFQVSSETSFPAGLVFDGTGTVMYVLGNSSSASFDRVIEYNLEDVAFEESLANTGVLEGTLTISIDGETFANSGGTLTSPEHFSIANSPAGLTPTLAVDASGSFANLVFSGSATSNDVSNDLDELQFTLTDDAFQMTTASEVSNSNKDVSVEVNFRPGEAVSIAKSLSYAIEPDITTAVFSNTVFEVNSQDSDPRGLAWNHDGTRLFILGTASDNVYQYDLTTPYDITTASFGIAEFNQFSISNENTDPRGIFFRPDGTRMYVVGTSGEDRIYQYDLVAPFDVSSASYNSISLNVFSQDNDPQAVRFNSDGTLMFLVGNSSNSIYQYSLTTPYDVSSASYDDVLIDLSTTDVTPVDLEFSADGSRLFISGTNADRIFAFDLSASYDISSSTALGSYSVSSESSFPAALTFDNSGKVMYVLGNSSTASFDRVIEYNLEDIAFEESLANTGELQGTLTVSIDGETFVNAGGILTSPEHFSIANSPVGLTPSLVVNSSGSFANLQFSGNSTENDVTDDLDVLEFSFTDVAFQTTTASEVSNTTKDVSVEVNFRPLEAIQVKSLNYNLPLNIENAFYTGQSLVVNSQDITSRSIAFNHDGTRLFYMGVSTDKIYQYDLSVPYDIATATYGTDEFNSFDFSGQVADTWGMTFHPEGTKLFIMDLTADRVVEYDLASPFDISSASYNEVSLVISSPIAPLSVRFSPDGLRMFILGNASSSDERIVFYTLTEPFNLSTASLSGTELDISGEETGTTDFRFSSDGSRIFTLGVSGDAIDQYELSTPFDISTAVFTQQFSVGSQAGFPSGFAFNGTGSRVIVVNDGNTETIFEYALDSIAYQETLANTGILEGSLEIGITGDTLVNKGGTLTSPEHFTITNLPEGLTATLSVDPEGLSAALQLSGSATSNDVTNNLDTLNFEFTDDAFVNVSAITVTNATAEVGLGIEFRPGSAYVAEPAVNYQRIHDIESAIFSENFFDASSLTSISQGFLFDDRGTRLFILSEAGQLFQLDLTEAYDVSTAVFNNDRFNLLDISAQESSTRGFTLSPNGGKLYVIGVSDALYEYDLLAPFDVSSGVYNGISFPLDIGTDDTFQAIRFNKEGDKMFVLGFSNRQILQYSLSTPFDISSAANANISLDVSAQEAEPVDIQFDPTGERLFLIGVSGDAIYEYLLTTAFDLTNATYSGKSFSVSTQSTFPLGGLYIEPSGTQLFVLNGTSSTDALFQYSLDKRPLKETSANNGAVSGELRVAISNEVFVNSGGTLTSPEHFSITNAPDGLTPQISVSEDGTLGYLEFIGTTSLNDSANNLDTLSFVFNDAAFTSSSASEVVNSAKDVSLGIEFRPGSARPLTPSLVYSPEIDINTISYSGNSIQVRDQESDPRALYFTPEGNRMFVLGFDSDAVYQYDLSIPFDISTTSFGRSDFNSFNVSDQLSEPKGIDFDRAGTRMYIIGDQSNGVYQYNLSAPFDVSSASYSGTSLDLNSRDESVISLRWNETGTYLYILGGVNEVIYRYELSVPYDLSSATFNGNSFTVGGSQEAEPRGFEIDKSGRQLFVIGSSGNDIDRYELSVPFDLLTSGYTGSVSVAAETSRPLNLYINESGNQLYVLANFTGSTSSDFIYQYSLGNTAFIENDLNDGSLTGSAFVNLFNGTFINANGVLTSPEHFTISNTPLGLEPRLNVDPTGTLATLEFLGNATANDVTDDLDTLRFSFTDAAFTNSAASEVTNSTAEVPIGVDFLQNPDLDLVITELNANSPVLINAPITISYQLTNRGTEAVGTSTTSIYLSEDDQFDAQDQLLTSRTEEALEGAAISFITDLQISEGLTAGSYTVFIFLDSGGEILESNEVNNLTSFALDVVPNLPNLNPFDLSHPDEANQGDEITVTYSVRNLGIAVAGTSTTRVYLSEDDTVDPTQDILLQSVAETSIQPQSTASREVSLTIPLEIEPGVYTVILELDALDEVEEVSENDNQQSFTLAVLKRPTADLSVAFVSGQAIDSLSTLTPLQYVISNKGNAASPVTTTAFYLSTDSLLSVATDVLITTKSETGIEIGEELSVDHEITLPSNADPGIYQILIQVDSDNEITEVDESDNLAIFRIELRLPGLPPDITGVTTSASTFELGRGGTMELSFQVEDRNDDLSVVELRYASGSVNFEGEEVNSVILTSTGDNRYTYIFEESDFDNLGLQFQIIATDAASLASSTAVRLVPVSFTDAIVNEFVAEAVENVGVGEEQVDYEMISIPFQNFVVDDLGMGPQTQSTTSGNVTTVTELWAVAGWNGTGFTDLSTQSQMVPGVGYWVLSTEDPSISFDEKNTVNAQFFELNLPQTVGFNLIGNPYLFDLDWTTIVDYNIEIGNLSAGQVDDQVYIYTNGGYDQTTTLSRFQGAFLQSSGAGDLIIPSFAVVGNSSGRSSKSAGRSQYSNGWNLPLHLSTPVVYNKVGAIGMRDGASIDQDQYDLPRLPRFNKFIDLSNSTNSEDVLSRDIVPWADTYLWELIIEKSPDAGAGQLAWSSEVTDQLDQELFLVVPDMNLILDMKQYSSLALKDQTSLKVQIVKGTLEEAYQLIDRQLTSISMVYPNPTSGEVQVEVTLTGVTAPKPVELHLTSLDGRVRELIYDESLISGVHDLKMDLTEFPSGIYLLQMHFNGEIVPGTLKILKSN